MQPHSPTPAHRALVLLKSGATLDLLDPDDKAWTDEDLAVGLSRTPRWAGQSLWPHSLSVAQHSLIVLAIRKAGQPCLSRQQQLHELLHDAEEGLLGYDCITPLKAVFGQPFLQLSRRIKEAVARRYALEPLTPPEHAAHKKADRTAAASEGLHVVGWTRQQLAEELMMHEAPLELDPISLAGYAPWEPWPARVAAEIWLHHLRSLSRVTMLHHGETSDA